MSRFNPEIHRRRSIRLRNYDYSQGGVYFVTICTYRRLLMFGDIIDGKMILNEFGEIAERQWQCLKNRFNIGNLSVFQIMPNHIHTIIHTITDNNQRNAVGATLAVALNADSAAPYAEHTAQNADCIVSCADSAAPYAERTAQNADCTARRAGASPAPTTVDVDAGTDTTYTVGDIVGAFKSLVYMRCLDLCKSNNKILGKIWQRNFYEHIIRNHDDYRRIAKYIKNNPVNWKDDCFYV